MSKAREIWKLKVGGAAPASISRTLSMKNEDINKVLKYTVHSHYANIINQPSYYDKKLLLEKKISLEKKKITQAIKSIAKKKKIIYFFLEITAVAILLLILV